jgi:putative solute:sodium symporter small subunit
VPRSAPPREVALPTHRPRDPVPEGRSRVAVAIVTALLALVALGLFVIAPGLGFVFFIVALPILFLTKPADGRSHPLAILGTVLGVLASCVIAFFLTCLGAWTLQGADIYHGFELAFWVGVVGAIATAFLLTVWLVRRARRRSAKHQAWNRTGIWEDS